MIGLISVAGGTHGLQAINTMEFVPVRCGAGPCRTSCPFRRRRESSDQDGQVRDAAIELQLRSLGSEVVRVAQRFAADPTLHRASECDEAAERVAAAA